MLSFNQVNKELDHLRKELGNVLEYNILDYWTSHGPDHKYGGFIGQVDFGNTGKNDANKGVVLNARILWTFSKAAQKLENTSFRVLADRAYEYILKFFIDETFGGVFWELDYKGDPIQTRKQVYAQAFAVYAFAEYYKSSQEDKAKTLAIELFELIEKHSYDSRLGGYVEAFAEDWSALEDMRLSERDLNAEKTMNTHLHVLEAYTNLYRIWPDQRLKAQQEKLIELFMDRFMKPDYHLNLFFSNEWENLSDIISYGHDIECAWLLTEAAEVIGNEQLLSQVRNVATQIADTFLEEAIDQDGGVINERHGTNGAFDYDRHWWPQAEALIGLMNAFTLSGNEKFVKSLLTLWQFIRQYMIDHQNGEWYWKVDKNGIPDTNAEKIGFWKCPYHNSRACFEMIDRIDAHTVSVEKLK